MDRIKQVEEDAKARVKDIEEKVEVGGGEALGGEVLGGVLEVLR